MWIKSIVRYYLNIGIIYSYVSMKMNHIKYLAFIDFKNGYQYNLP